MGDQPLGHGHDVGLAVSIHRTPHHAQAGLALGAEGGVVDRAAGLELSVQGPGVQCPPHSVLTAHPSGDQDMGVELGITGSRGAVHEGGTEEAFGVDLADTGLALAGKRCVFLQV